MIVKSGNNLKGPLCVPPNILLIKYHKSKYLSREKYRFTKLLLCDILALSRNMKMHPGFTYAITAQKGDEYVASIMSKHNFRKGGKHWV